MDGGCGVRNKGKCNEQRVSNGQRRTVLLKEMVEKSDDPTPSMRSAVL